MYNKERIERIFDLLKEKGSISVNELSVLFQVSGATIRSDLAKMEKAGLITRAHGGAMANSSLYRETLLTERIHDGRKKLIAQRALEYVHERDIILLDTGTTMVAFAEALAKSSIEELSVYSNDLDVIRILEEKEKFSLTLLGGKVRNRFHYCYGPEIQNELSNFHFTSLFLAASAIHEVYGLTTENTDLAGIKRSMIKASADIILLSDSSKIGNVHLRKFASLSDVDTLIMDQNLTAEEEQMLSSSVRNLILV